MVAIIYWTVIGQIEFSQWKYQVATIIIKIL